MTLKIDKAGRVVLPKATRDRFGLNEGGTLEMNEDSDVITLKPVAASPALVQIDGFWVYTGKLPANFDILEAIHEDREDRIRHLSGL